MRKLTILLVATLLTFASMPADAKTRVAEFKGSGNMTTAIFRVESPWILDWRLDGQLTRMLLSGDVLGKAGEHVMLQNNGKLKSDWVLFVGGGQWAGLSEETHAALIRHMLKVASQAGFTKISLAFMPHGDVSDESLHQQISDAMAVEGHNISECRYSCLATVTV